MPKGRGNKANWLGNLQPEEQHSGVFVGFLLAPHIPDWELKNPQSGNVNSVHYKSTREVRSL